MTGFESNKVEVDIVGDGLLKILIKDFNGAELGENDLKKLERALLQVLPVLKLGEQGRFNEVGAESNQEC